jgi:hypothetical protein
MNSAVPKSARTAPTAALLGKNNRLIISRLQGAKRSTKTAYRLKYYKNVTFTLVCRSAPPRILNLSEQPSDLRLSPHE